MKCLALFILLASTSLFAHAHTPDLNLIRAVTFLISSVANAAGPDLALYNATTLGAKVKVILQIVDQQGKPIPDAAINGATYAAPIRRTTVP